MHHFDDLEEPHIDLTPLIDTVFLLLIFFIMATTFAKPVLEVALAQADNAAAADTPEKHLSISINRQGEIFFDQNRVGEDEVHDRLALYPPDAQIIFNIDQGAPFGSFVRVLDTAKGQQRSNFVINAASPLSGNTEDARGRESGDESVKPQE